MKIFAVVLEWSVPDRERGVEFFLFKEHHKAYDKFKELICEEHNANTSWVGDVEFDEDGEPIDERYQFEFEDNASGESEVYWRIEDLSLEDQYTFIELRILKVE